MNELRIIEQREVLNKNFTVYGDFENPLFLAKDVAEWIEHSNATVMLQGIDESEKVLNNVYTLGGNQESWFLTEDGLYEVLMQSRKPIAKQFKAQVKQILREIRKTGKYEAKQPAALPTDRLRIQTMNAEARLEYARIRKAELFLKLSNVDTLSTEYKGILVAQATEVLAGQPLLPPVPSVQKTHSATDLAEMFSTTAAMIGRITNAKGLKTEEYGENYRAKSRYSTKEVDTFRYYDTIIPVLEKFFSKQPALTTV